jgi:hypothetical protein
MTEVDEAGGPPVTDEATERQVERLAGAIYGTILVAGVLAATTADDAEVGDTALYVFATVLVFWLAHAWADSLARRVTATRRGLKGFRTTLANQWPLVQSAFPPIVVMIVASVLGADDEAAITWGAWSCVVLLAGWGIVVARKEKESAGGIVGTSVACAALGFLMIALKSILD